CLLQDGDDLAVGESGSLHCRTFKKLIEKILLLMAIICRGDYPRSVHAQTLIHFQAFLHTPAWRQKIVSDLSWNLGAAIL
ncbi:hypothetical protein, partial [Burkholderia sp. LMU1-1-1.1]|uniref:hypothetical protein n=1 Tax=Burkholderia sp. LMU1-1-1.1 TaxID=3135266 RepID=UPI00341641D1